MQHVARCVRQLTTPGLCRISALVPIISSTTYKHSLFRLRLPSEESGMVFTLLRSGASNKITLNGNAPFRIPAVSAPATACPPRPPGYSAPHIRVPPPTFRALNLPCSGFAFPAKSKAGYVGFLIPLRFAALHSQPHICHGAPGERAPSAPLPPHPLQPSHKSLKNKKRLPS